MRDCRYRILLLCLGTVACLPLILHGFPYPAHDAGIHLRWAHQFSAEFWSGILYPRWLAGISFGFGSAAFFYYPPMPYWASSLFTPLAAGLGVQGADWRALGWASALGLILSGQTAFFCFRGVQLKVPGGAGVSPHFFRGNEARSGGKRCRTDPDVTSPERAFFLALVYMIAPYHLAIDLLERAAYPEFWAFVWMPLALGGLIGLAKNRRWSWGMTVFGLAMLYMTHLPATLIFMPFVLIFAFSQGRRTFAKTCGAVAVACGVAAVFLVPALTTEGAVNLRQHPFPYRLTFFFPSLNTSALLRSMGGVGVSPHLFRGNGGGVAEKGAGLTPTPANLRAPLFSMDPFNERLLVVLLLFGLIWLGALGSILTPSAGMEGKVAQKGAGPTPTPWLGRCGSALARRVTWATGRDRVIWLGLGLIALVMMLPVSNFVYKLIPAIAGRG
jgi:hypothetical protein